MSEVPLQGGAAGQGVLPLAAAHQPALPLRARAPLPRGTPAPETRNPEPEVLLRLFFFTLGTGPSRSLGLKLSDIRVYEPQMRARLGNHNTPVLGFC